jgi:hypothetical protein
MSPVKYELDSCIPQDGILHSHRRENLKSHSGHCSADVMSPVRYKLGSYIPHDGILHSHRRENLKSHIVLTGWNL